MSKVIFNDKQIKVLAKNPNVLRVSDKAITYSEEFKNRFIEENSKGVLPRKIFEENGFDIEIIGTVNGFIFSLFTNLSTLSLSSVSLTFNFSGSFIKSKSLALLIISGSLLFIFKILDVIVNTD